LALHTFKDDESILKAHKIWLTVIEKVRSGEMPPKGKPQPSPQEIDLFEKSVKGVFDRYARSGKRDPGRVTMRRLSKYEYQTTIRDLLGVRIPLATLRKRSGTSLSSTGTTSNRPKRSAARRPMPSGCSICPAMSGSGVPITGQVATTHGRTSTPLVLNRARAE
jgi:hypothetical protein